MTLMKYMSDYVPPLIETPIYSVSHLILHSHL